LDGNIEPILPFNETIPDEPTEPEEPPTYVIDGVRFYNVESNKNFYSEKV
jgi:hypothetical protein